MVTVGDKIAWWCLDHLPRKKASSILNQRARKTSVPADTYNPFQRRRRTSESNVAAISPGKNFFWNLGGTILWSKPDAMILGFYCKGPFFNYVDKILPIIDY